MASGTQLAIQSRFQKKQVFEEFFQQIIYNIKYTTALTGRRSMI